MSKISFHIHTNASDGVIAPEEVVREAIKAGFSHLCFTDHYPRPDGVKSKWDEKFYDEDYKKEILQLKKQYGDKINLSIGVEFDWLDGYEKYYKKAANENKFDFILGSIHYLNINGKWLTFDDEEGWQESEGRGGAKELVKKYFSELRKMIKSELFDCVGHFDYIKVYNNNSRLFSEKEDWYKEEVFKTLEEIKKSGMCMEINARGWRKPVAEQYPSEWILEEARKMGIPITIGTDFHGKNGEKIDENLERVISLAKKVGYKTVLIFKNRKREEVII